MRYIFGGGDYYIAIFPLIQVTGENGSITPPPPPKYISHLLWIIYNFILMYKHFIWKKWKETNYLYSIENGNGDCVKETTTVVDVFWGRWMDWSGLLLLTLLGHETESRVTSVSGNVLDQVNIYLRHSFSKLRISNSRIT
jgi:hypothetical protein